MEKQLKNWLEAGLLTQEKYLELIEDYKKKKEKRIKVANQIALYIIGAVLLGFGINLFISANDWLLELFNNCPILKIILMFLLTSGSLFFGYKFAYETKKLPRLGSALIFLSTILIGGTYALIGQIYNTEANTSFIYLLWLISVYPLAFLFKNKAINILSILLYVLAAFFYYDNLSYKQNVTEIFVPIILSSFLYLIGNIPKIKNNYPDFSFSYKITSLIVIFITLIYATFENLSSKPSFEAPYIIPVIFLLALNGFNLFYEKEKTEISNFESIFLSALSGYLLILFCSGNSQLEFFTCLIAHGFIIALITALYSFSNKLEDIRLKGLANKFLIFYIVVTYIRIGSNFLEGAAFFLVSGAILFGLGFYFEKKKREKLK